MHNRYTENVKILQIKINARKTQYHSHKPSDQVLQQWIREEISCDARLYLEGYDEDTLVSMYFDAYKGYGILQSLILDQRWSDIKMVAWDRIWTKGKEGWIQQGIQFSSELKGEKYVQAVFNRNRSTLNVKYPFNNCIDDENRLRINGSLGDINPMGAFMVIRKQTHYRMSDEELIQGGTANEKMLALIAINMWMDSSFFVYGEQNTGKTTFLANCLDKIPEHVALTSIEDTPEFSLKKQNWHAHVTRPHVGEGFDPVTMENLIFNFFRESGGWNCVGEVRGKEAFYLLHAVSGGNPACMSVHASSSDLALKRLLFLSLSASGMKEETLEAYFRLYFKMAIGMTADRDRKRVQVIAIESDKGNQFHEVWTRRHREDDWDFHGIPDWYVNKALQSSVPEELLVKAGMIT